MAPKQIDPGPTLKELFIQGETEHAKQLCLDILHADEKLDEIVSLLDQFIDKQDNEALESIIGLIMCFREPSAQGVILFEALEQRRQRLVQQPDRQLILMRRFSEYYRFTSYEYLEDYLHCMRQLDELVTPEDVMSAILNIKWYNTDYMLDEYGNKGISGGFGKAVLSKNRHWAELTLEEYMQHFKQESLVTHERAIDAFYGAYTYLHDRFQKLREDERWVSEAQLGDALCSLFGINEVHRHARPLWLSPQHLDFYLPNYNLAVEYMGAQHYKPVDYFGGQEQLKQTQQRDQRKRTLCMKMGIELVYVNYQQDIGRSAREIHQRYFDRCISLKQA